MRTRHLIIAAAAACVILPSLSFGQVGKAGPSFGILLGTNIATISDADQGIGAAVGGAFNKKQRIGLNAGVFLKIPLAGMVSLQPEAHYAQNGVSIESKTGTIQTLDVKIDYVEIPVLLRLDVGTGSVHPVFMAGASAAYRIKCQLFASAGTTSLTRDCKVDAATEDTFKKTDFSVVGGAGLATTAMGRSYSLQLRYTYGLTDIATNSTATTQPKNRTISILLGLGF